MAADGTLSQADIDNAVNLLETVKIAGSGTLSSNRTTVVGRGFSVIEIPVSYGRAINDNLSLGITAKGMYGSVRGTRVWIFNRRGKPATRKSATIFIKMRQRPKMRVWFREKGKEKSPNRSTAGYTITATAATAQKMQK